jgi:hypothetical protein
MCLTALQAEKYKLSVLLDLHGAPGSQNGKRLQSIFVSLSPCQ